MAFLEFWERREAWASSSLSPLTVVFRGCSDRLVSCFLISYLVDPTFHQVLHCLVEWVGYRFLSTCPCSGLGGVRTQDPAPVASPERCNKAWYPGLLSWTSVPIYEMGGFSQ